MKLFSILLVLFSVQAHSGSSETDSPPTVLATIAEGFQTEALELHALLGRRTDPPNLHGFRIHSSVTLISRDSINSILEGIQRELEYDNSGMAICFDPHHAITFYSGADTVDVLICYKCRNLKIYKNSEEIAYVTISNSSETVVSSNFEKAGLPNGVPHR